MTPEERREYERYRLRKRRLRQRFDFEVGTLVRSPCRSCAHRSRLPACAHRCRMLEEIQEVLSQAISCSRPG